MKKIYWICMLLGITLQACSEKESTLDLSMEKFTMDAVGNPVVVEVTTNGEPWQVVGKTDWVIVNRDDNKMEISALTNPYRKTRNMILNIATADRVARIHITQEGSLREVGELYPDDQNPIGMIYLLTDGGAHGKVVSLKEYVNLPGGGAWSPNGSSSTVDTNQSMTDGRANTITMINKFSYTTSTGKFALEVNTPGFWWLYATMNNNDIDGPWYIPAAYELDELYYALTGNSYIAPATTPSNIHAANPFISHDFVLRDRLDHIMASNGGSAITYSYATNVFYFSSTSYTTKTQVWSVKFSEGIGSIGLSMKGLASGWRMRAIMTF